MRFTKKKGCIRRFPSRKKTYVIDSDYVYMYLITEILEINKLSNIRKLNKLGIISYKINKLF